MTTLQSEPSPPVPEQFVARLMSRARLETQSSPYSPGIRQVFRSWWNESNPARLANAVAAVATGVLLGLALGQQTWQLPNGVEEQPTTYRVVDSLDYFSGYAGKSFAETYLSLTNAPSAQES